MKASLSRINSNPANPLHGGGSPSPAGGGYYRKINLLLAIAFAFLMSVNSAYAQAEGMLLEMSVNFFKNAYIKDKQIKEKLSEIEPTYNVWTDLLKNYVLKTGAVGDCKAIGLKQLPNNQGETLNFSFRCGVEENGNIAFLEAKSKSKIGSCPEQSTFKAEYDIRKNYLEVHPFPITEACTFFEARCKSFVSESCPSNMVFVGAGTGQMGSNFDDYDSRPPRNISVDGFCIGKYEVTQKEWQEVMGNNPSKFKNCGGNCPVEQVSWNDTQEFIRKLNAKTGKNYRLPTEAEWEYAARGGCQSKGFIYSGSNKYNDVAWYSANSNKQTHAVGTKRPNELGIYDMSGNVPEYVSDWFGSYKLSDVNNPKGPSSGSKRIARGGDYLNSAVRVSYRNDRMLPNEASLYKGARVFGFRLAHPPMGKAESAKENPRQSMPLFRK